MVVLSFENGKCYLNGYLRPHKPYELLSLISMEITEIIGKVPHDIRELDLSDNSIEDISRLNTNRLAWLSLAQNKIEKVDIDFKKITQLALDYNFIKSIENINTARLYYLSISHNLIEEVINLNTENLIQLHLNNNKIKRVCFKTGKLKFLSLSYNDIESVDELIIDPNLSDLFLVGNKLTEFKKTGLKGYNRINLHSNNITNPFNIETDVMISDFNINGIINEKGKEIIDMKMLNEYKDYIIQNRKKSARK